MDKDSITKIRFESITHGQLSALEVIEEIKNFLEKDPNGDYSLVIGTDSHEKTKATKQGKTINLVTAILVHKKGFGGKYFWCRNNAYNVHSLREKIYAETMRSLNFAIGFLPLFRERLNGNSPKYNLEIHIDVGEHGDTRDMIKEVVGMVTGSGFVAKTKPEAYGASYVADRYT